MRRMPLALRQTKRVKAKAAPKAKSAPKADFAIVVAKKPAPKALDFLPPGGALLPDTPRFKCRFDLPSANPESDAIYRVSFDMARKTWVCSCRGFMRWQSKPGFRGCHHIKDCGLEFRKGGDELTYKQMLLREK